MFAAAMAYSMGIKLETIRQGLRTFDTTFFQAPGRANVYDEHPFKVILDYGHNAHAVGAMTQLAARLDVAGRRIVVLAGPGDRRDEDLREIAQATAGRFDHYICRRDDSLRGRDGDEVPRIMAAALQAAGVAAEQIAQIPDEQAANDAALRMAQAGDLVLVCGDAIVRGWKQIIHFAPDGAPRRVTAEHPIPRLTPQEAAPATEPLQLPELGTLVRDDRGVRLAREDGD
jgi:cyanophycin synthetase